MPANIMQQEGDARLVLLKEPGWHGLGHVIQEPIDAVTAVERYKMAYSIDLYQLQFFAFEMLCPTEKYAVVREAIDDDPTPRVLGFASRDYKILQNATLAQMINPLTEKWPVETVGCLGHGETIFFALDAGDYDLGKGELVHNYFVVSDTRDGGTSLKIVLTPYRPVCGNTLVLGIREASVRTSVFHMGEFRREVQARVDLIKQAQESHDKVMRIMQATMGVHLTEMRVEEFFAAVYHINGPAVLQDEAVQAAAVDPMADDIFAVAISRANAQAASFQEKLENNVARAGAILARMNDERPLIANTAWAAYNAVVEAEDYPQRPTPVATQSALFGWRGKVKAKAFEFARGMIT